MSEENVESLAKAMMKASELGRVISAYKSASMDDFHHVLEFATKPGGKRLRLKYIISLTPPISWYLNILKKINDKRLYKLREQYIPDIRKIVTPDTSIISSNCFAGRIMQDLDMQYNTPTLGLYFFADDYIEFLSNLKYYLTEAKLEFLEQSRYPLANEETKNTNNIVINLLGLYIFTKKTYKPTSVKKAIEAVKIPAISITILLIFFILKPEAINVNAKIVPK
jgi:hypothetical protein